MDAFGLDFFDFVFLLFGIRFILQVRELQSECERSEYFSNFFHVHLHMALLFFSLKVLFAVALPSHRMLLNKKIQESQKPPYKALHGDTNTNPLIGLLLQSETKVQGPR